MARFHCIKTSLAIVTLASLWGCGGGGGSTTAETSCSAYSSTGTTSTSNTDTGTTAGVFCSYATQMQISSYSVLKAGTCAIVTWSCSSTTRSVSANGLPDYTLSRTVNGVSVTDSASNIAFPNTDNPNTIVAQSVSQSMTLTPTQTSAVTATNSGTQKLGMALNGIVFDPSTAGTCTNAGACNLGGGSGAWNIEALGQSSFKFGTDNSNAHVQPQGTYHYHGIPEQLVTKLKALNTNTAMTLIGWAVDGFPVYARYGYTDPLDTSSAIKTIKSSYQLQTTVDAARPSTTTYPLGAFTQDYEYIAGSGDLDACNGRTGKTPEFPNGTYHYYATDTFPHLQRCVYGKLN
jgi:YHYH protein